MQIKTTIVSCHTADSKPVKEEINGTVILSPLVFPGHCYSFETLLKYPSVVISLAGTRELLLKGKAQYS